MGSEVHKAPFEVPKLGLGHEGQPATKPGPVFQMSVRSQELGELLVLTLWPSLGRVDVRLGRSSWVLQGITSVLVGFELRARVRPGREEAVRRGLAEALSISGEKAQGARRHYA